MGLRTSKERVLRFAVYLAVIVLVNIAGQTLFFRLDLTRDRMFSLSPASRQAVAGLSEPLTIKVFFSANLPAPHNGTEQYLRDLLEAYAIHGNRFFNYTFYAMGDEGGQTGPEQADARRQAADYGIEPIQIQVIEKDEVRFQKAYMGLVLIHGDLIERVTPITAIDGLEYRLTTALGRLNNKVSALMALTEPVRVKLFFSETLKAMAPYMGLPQLPELPKRLAEAAEAVSAKNHGKIVFERTDPQPSQLQSEALRRYNLLTLQWPAMDGGKVPAGAGAIGLVMEHKDKVISIPIMRVVNIPLLGTQYALVPLEDLPTILDDNVGSLIRINEDIGILAGKGTFDFAGMASMDPTGRRQPDPIDNLRRQLDQHYSLKDVDLAAGIPASLKCLVIARPTEAFSDYELLQIDQFLMQGKSLAICLDPFQEAKGPARGGPPPLKPVATGLEKLLTHWGIATEAAYVMDENCYKQRIPDQMGGGERPLYFAPVLKSGQIDQQPGFMRNIKGLVALRAAPVATDAGRLAAAGLSARKLLVSSERSWIQRESISLNPELIRPPADPQRQSFGLGVLVEGPFASYFADKPMPEKPPAPEETLTDDKGVAPEKPAALGPAAAAAIESKGAVVAKGKPGKVFFLGSAEMLTDVVIDEEGRGPNAIFVLNTIDYLNDREQLARLRGKQQRFNPLAPTTPALRTAIKTANIVGPPLLVALGGVIVWIARRARQKRIQAQFS